MKIRLIDESEDFLHIRITAETADEQKRLTKLISAESEGAGAFEWDLKCVPPLIKSFSITFPEGLDVELGKRMERMAYKLGKQEGLPDNVAKRLAKIWGRPVRLNF